MQTIKMPDSLKRAVSKCNTQVASVATPYAMFDIVLEQGGLPMTYEDGRAIAIFENV